MLREPGCVNDRSDGYDPKAGEYLASEKLGGRPDTDPFFDGALVRRVLGTPKFGCLPTVCRISLFRAERDENPTGILTRAVAVLFESFLATAFAVAMVPARELLPAVAAGSREHERSCTRLHAFALWRAGVPSDTVVRAGQRGR